MLPEYLFSVGNSMRDISRDDFNLLNGAGCEKDMCSSVIRLTASPLSPKVTQTTSTDEGIGICLNSTATTISGIKLEDTASADLLTSKSTSWHRQQQLPQYNSQTSNQHHPHNEHRLENGSSKLLLQGSDDPLISRGANIVADDDHPVEFNSLIAAVNVNNDTVDYKNSSNGHNIQSAKQQQKKVKAPGVGLTSSTTTSKLPAKTPRSKRKGAIKLRFHHQALPPEYLSHYEATQGQHIPKVLTAKETVTSKLTVGTKMPSAAKNVHENVRSWLQKIAEIQRVSQQDVNNNKDEGTRSPILLSTEKIPSTTFESLVSPSPAPQIDHNANIRKPTAAASASGKRVINYSDLPYMGEITLDNSKPRRGRKPKKADICHLIYKNYGTIFPGTPKSMLASNEKLVTSALLNATNVKNSAYETLSSRPDEPLNLCLRDQSADSYSISSGDDDESDSKTNSNCPTPVTTASDVVTDSLLAANLKISMTSLQDNHQSSESITPTEMHSNINKSGTTDGCANPLYWANPNLLLHPMKYYYQKLIESGTLSATTVDGSPMLGFPLETINKNNQLSLKIPIRSGLFLTPPKQEKASIPPLEYPEPLSTPSSIKSENSLTTTTTTGTAVTTVSSLPQASPQKRKRSAIFIPPMPAENTTNPATEVSICKFKFTGGAKPTLQEKKMLSVDSDGNYRYYSGTGDKSMRGYEFFPRESLQQSGVVPGVNCSGAFLNATGEKITLDIPPPSAGLSNELLQISESPSAGILLPPVSVTLPSITSSPQSSCSVSPFSSPNQHLALTNTTAAADTVDSSSVRADRKKKSRRSMQREKLEKTFKEKGFLIQTQQLESAEGATYCKFRQLKKFTRYLFRNWKDYLPEELQQANAAAAAAAAAAAVMNNNHQGQHQHLHQQAAVTSSTIGNILTASYAKQRLTRETERASASIPLVEKSLV